MIRSNIDVLPHTPTLALQSFKFALSEIDEQYIIEKSTCVIVADNNDNTHVNDLIGLFK